LLDDTSVETASAASPALWPILLSAGLFAALHATHGPDPIPLFLLALGLGYLYQRTIGSCRAWWCISCSTVAVLVTLLIDVLAKP